MFRWIRSHSRQHLRRKSFMQHLSHLHNLRQGYTLSSGTCVACSLPANCASCSPSGATTCVKCNKGFTLTLLTPAPPVLPTVSAAILLLSAILMLQLVRHLGYRWFLLRFNSSLLYSMRSCTEKTEFFITSIAD